MTRDRFMPPEDLGKLATELLRQLRSEGAVITAEHVDRRALDDERRRRDEEALRRDAEERRARVVSETLRSVLPPKEFAIITGTPRQTEASKLALDWWDECAYRVLVLRGPMGVGKTAGVALMCKHAVEHGKRSISWHTPDDFVSAVLHGYADDAPDLGTDLVVIDDTGEERKSDFGPALKHFLDRFTTRIAMTTNDTRETFRSRYDPRLLERIAEDGIAYTIKGASMRRKGGGF